MIVHKGYDQQMLRVSEETRRQILQMGRDEFGGATADETVQRLIEEHWQVAALTAVHRYRDSDPQGWAQYIADADALAGADAPLRDEWV